MQLSVSLEGRLEDAIVTLADVETTDSQCDYIVSLSGEKTGTTSCLHYLYLHKLIHKCLFRNFIFFSIPLSCFFKVHCSSVPETQDIYNA